MNSSDTFINGDYPKPIVEEITKESENAYAKRKIQKKLYTFWILSLIILGTSGLVYLYLPDISDVIEDIEDPTGAKQAELFSRKEFVREIDDWKFRMVSDYRYTLTGKVVGKDEYKKSALDKLIPMDLGIAWGDVIDPENSGWVRFTKGNRHLTAFYNFPEGTDFSTCLNFCNQISNNHLIFADETVHDMAKEVQVGDIVKIEGYLTNVYGVRIDGARTEWLTSTKRYGTLCETIYVKKITILEPLE
ncbi:MAG: hypothetical protein SVM80_09370 [Halobacteriota archaeon]|nr:hypothetical protein [Halobacteriota archaeon]